ncbi:MAG: hypothetical protein AAF599_13570, partial [Bacteroidota bacterium]
MKDLIDLIKIITPESLTQIDLFTPKIKARTKINQLYHKIRLGEIQNNENGIKQLYNKEEKGNQKFVKLKYALKNKLFNNTLLLQIDKKIFPRKAIFFDSSRMLLVSKFLILQGGRRLGVHLLKQLLPTVMKQEFTIQALESSKLLRQYYTIHKYEPKEIQHYDNLIYDLLETLKIETKADSHYYELLSHFSARVINYEVLNQLAKQYESELSHFSTQKMTADSILKVKMITIIERASRFDFEGVRLACTGGVQLLRQKSYKHQAAIFTIYLQWIRACLQLNDLQKARELLPQLEQCADAGTYNWFQNIKIQIQLAIRSGNYDEVPSLYKKLYKLRANFKTNQRVIEELNLLALAIHVLIKGKLLIWRSSSRFLEEIEDLKSNFKEFGKRKLEMNIPIVTYPLFLKILDKDYDTVIDKIDALERYDTRYLKQCASPRHHYFFTLILNLVKKDFDHCQIKSIEYQYLEKLKNPQDDFIDLDAELIPYE